MRKKIIIISAIVVFLGGLAALVGIVFVINEHRVQQQVDEIKAHEREQIEKATHDDVGGATPQETLQMLAKAIADGNAQQAAALCVSAIRERVEAGVLNASVEDRSKAAKQIEEATISGSLVGDSSFVASEPIYVELIRYPAGVWKVVSF